MKQVNCRADYVFQVDVKTPNAAGVLAAPVLGAVTGLKLRLASTPGGAAINAAVDDLTATETTTAGRLGFQVDAALLTTHVLGTVNDGGKFYAVWSKSGDLDKVSVPFIARDGEII